MKVNIKPPIEVIILRKPQRMPWDKLHSEFQPFAQGMVNRLYNGYFRYEADEARVADHKYLKRARNSLRHYRETKNREFLIDAANYCYLESIRPSFRNTYFKPSDSHGKRKFA